MTSKSQDQKQDYKNDLVHVIVHRKPNCVIEYEVEVFRPLCVEAYKKSAKGVGKEVVVPGFRKGKAPPEIVAKRYPHDLDKKWQEIIANTAYKEAAQLVNIPVISPDATITFKMLNHSQNGAKLILTFETIPIIPSIDPAKCVLQEIKRPEVSSEKIDETIRQTQMFFAKWQVIEDRPVKENDFILVDVDIIEEEPIQRLFTNTRFEVTDRSMAQWMKKLVLGKKPGDVVEGISEPDPTLSEEEKKQYPPKKVRVTIKALDEAVLPELNDAFAKQLGVEHIEELKNRIETLLNKKADEHVREQKREQVTEFLLSHHFEIPPSIIEKETKFRLEQMIRDPQFKAKWDQSNDQERRDLVNTVKDQAEKAVRIFYLCRKISADQNMSITPKDIPLISSDPLETLLFPSEDRHDPRQPDVKQAEAYSRILLEKTEDWIIAHARIGTPTKKQQEPKEPEPQKEEEQPKRKSPPKKSSGGPSESVDEKPKRKSTSKSKKEE